LSFVRGSTTTRHSPATATDASLAGKTVFFGNNRAVNGRGACIGDSGRDKSAKQCVSSDVANARGCAGEYDEFAAYRNGRTKFTKSCHRGDSNCRGEYDQFAAYRHCRAKFNKTCHCEDSSCGREYDQFAAYRHARAKFDNIWHRGNSNCGGEYDQFAAWRHGRSKFAKFYHHRDCVRF
jgi:hypothetical protein